VYEAVFPVMVAGTDERPAGRHGYGYPFFVFGHQRIEKFSTRLHAIGKRDVGIDRGVDRANVIPERRIGQGVVDIGKLRVKLRPQASSVSARSISESMASRSCALLKSV
jgi:hypothetical protein